MLSEPKIIFHHIPKCGGTSFVTSLVLTYYPFRFLRYGKKGFSGILNAPESTRIAQKLGMNRYDYREQLLEEHAKKNDSPLISGHYPVNHNFLDSNLHNWHFITVLRDPVERWYSEYFWNRYKDHDYQKTDLSMEEYLETEDGKINTRSFINYFSRSKNYSGNATTSNVLESIETLQKFHVVGFLENIPRFQSDMKSSLGRKPLMIKRNKSPANSKQQQKPDAGSKFHQNLLKKLEADIEIYKKMKELKNI